MKRIMYYIDVITFVGIIFFFTISNRVNISSAIKKQMEKNDIYNASAIEQTYKDNFAQKTQAENLYGLSQELFGKSLVGNFAMFRDEIGMMHMCSFTPNTEAFVQDVITLNDKLAEKDIPLLYVQIPSREEKGYSSYPSDVFNNVAIEIENTLTDVKGAGIECLDIGDLCKEDNIAPHDFFFYSDLHLQTDAELWVAEKIADRLEIISDCRFDRTYFDMSNYAKETYGFFGNLARQSGKYYATTDEFDMYFPKFDTSLVLDNNIQGVVREGTFEETLMNQYTSNSEADEYTYWVTNYLQYTSPYYTITNNMQDNNRILIIMDSMCFRTTAYLSLASKEIVVLDSRFFGNIDYLSNVLENNEFDAVVICHQTSLFDYKLFAN